MKKLLVGLVVTFTFLIAPTRISANDEYSPNVVVVEEGEIIESDHFAFGDVVEIYGTVLGDLYAAGGQVLVAGTVDGDLLVAGGTVEITGEVTQDVRMGAGEARVSGVIGRNLTSGTGTLVISENAVVGGNIVSGSGDMDVRGIVDGNINAGAGMLTISNVVGGNVKAATDDLRLTSGAVIEGDLKQYGQKDPQISAGATVVGMTDREAVENNNYQTMEDHKGGINFGWWIFMLMLNSITGLVIIKVAPNLAKMGAKTARMSPLKSAGVGLLAYIMTPILILLALITILGAPLGFALLLVFVFSVFISKYFALYAVGGFLLDKAKKPQSIYVTYLVGLLVYAVLTIIPLLNFLTYILVALLGFGAFILTGKEWYAKSKKEKLI